MVWELISGPGASKTAKAKKRSKQGHEGKSECTFGTFLGFNVSKHRCKNDLKCQEIKPLR